MGGERIRGRRADGAASIIPAQLLRAITAGGGQRHALGRLCLLARLREGIASGGVQLGGELLARLARRQPDHEGDAARVGAQVDRREIGVGRDDGHLARIAAHLLGGDLAEERVDALPDVGGAAEDRHAAGAVELHQHTALRHLVGIDGISRAADVHRAGHAQPAPAAQLAVAHGPARGLFHQLEAFQETVGGDALAVDRLDELADEVAPAHLDGIDAELLGRLVERHLQGEARLY